ncbi:MAG: toprim domain-containing protein [Flavobacterium sp.]|uniref:toprim domain-containing protein n=1 Tax=Flavobacterium sp. TaxID=239 RepID=UPI0032631880
MNCEQANQIDLVDYLYSIGFSPNKISGENHWYLSPLHQERTASFKVNKSQNIWYDHGIGKGGKLVDFLCLYLNCQIPKALQKLVDSSVSTDFSIHQQKTLISLSSLDDGAIRVLSIKNPIVNQTLISYINQRNISNEVANEFCKEICYKTGENTFCAIGFKNNSGGYELRSPNFKGAVSPKYVTWLDNRATSISVFEGFFDFLSYRSMKNIREAQTNILVLNSLSFFTRSLLLMEKHERIHLYLDNDKAGKECLQQAMQRTNKVIDESSLYQGYKDLNEWSVSLAADPRLEQSRGLRR